MNKLFSLAVAALVMAACNTSGSRNSEATAPAPAPAATAMPSVQLPGAGNVGTVTNTQTAPPTTNSEAQVALNPAHGAPGHRCEIPVGAPLNTPVNSTPAGAPNINTAPPVMITPPAPSMPANGNVRLNPAHGAPGHDCNIPVGQPLRS